jgi:uncharacterized protein DUF6069
MAEGARFNSPPLWRAALVAVLASVAINLVARLIALAVLQIPADNHQLNSVGPVATLTTVGAFGAIAVFALVRRLARRPAFVFMLIAGAALLLSFIPDVLLLVHHQNGTTPVSVAVLMFLHVLAAITIVWTLVRLGLPKPGHA